VVVEAQGDYGQLQVFARALERERPPLAKVEKVLARRLPVREGEAQFVIAQSRRDGAGTARVAADVATCPACVAEVLGPGERRRGYGLTNCTNCGPRYSIVARVPYDRCNTTMAPFAMCPACRAEYEEPQDRRFHAQPIACGECGPAVRLVEGEFRGQSSEFREEGAGAIRAAAEMLVGGKIVAIKGVGGFHLAVRADDDGAVGRLRELKRRDHKPFAVMVPSVEAARELVELSAAGEALMRSGACPIVLARRKDWASSGGKNAPARSPMTDKNVCPTKSARIGGNVCPTVARGVAPGMHRLGVMLPYTPIHHLLWEAIAGRVPALVMTSGNVASEPLAIDNEEAGVRLGGMCDALLVHDRPIRRCVDDSVYIDVRGGEPLPLRRSRGMVPAGVTLPVGDGGMGLCVGGELKNTVAVVRDGQAIVGQHLGDLTHPLAFAQFKQAIADLLELFEVKPAWVACDRHPLYQSRVYAVQFARDAGVPLVEVQHHHAHAAALMAEHGEIGPILAIVCDGVGYGDDGTSWGGELLWADLCEYRRLGHLEPLSLPGGDAAARDGRRCAVAMLGQALGSGYAAHPAFERLVPDAAERSMFTAMLASGVRCSTSSAAGRVFDGIAALLGACAENRYEGEAAMRLEAMAAGVAPPAELAGALYEVGAGDVVRIGFGPLVRRIADAGAMDDGARVRWAAAFHDQFARAWDEAAGVLAERTGVRTVGLSGGVFCNELLTVRLTELLERRGLRVLRHRVAPPNDGGIALGQAAVAVSRMHSGGRNAPARASETDRNVGHTEDWNAAAGACKTDKNVCPTESWNAAALACKTDKNVCPTEVASGGSRKGGA